MAVRSIAIKQMKCKIKELKNDFYTMLATL